MSKGDIGLLLLAAAKRNWQATQLRMYNCAFYQRVGTAFPASVISQPNTHRVPEKILQSIYSLRAQGLGLATLKKAK